MRHILPRTSAGINQAAVAQLPPGCEIVLSPLALRIRAVRPSAVGTLNPADPQPAQILDHGLDKLRTASLRIQILIAQNQSPSARGRPLRRNPERARMAEMQQSSRRRCQPPAITSGTIGWERLGQHRSGGSRLQGGSNAFGRRRIDGERARSIKARSHAIWATGAERQACRNARPASPSRRLPNLLRKAIHAVAREN